MNEEIIIKIINFSLRFTHDQIVFWLLQFLLIGILFYAIFRSLQESFRNKYRGLRLSIKRGKVSIGYFNHFATFFITAILAVIFNITEVAQGYKVFIFLVNVAVILYLSYWNNWSKNKLIGLYGKIKDKKEE